MVTRKKSYEWNYHSGLGPVFKKELGVNSKESKEHIFIS